MTYRLLFDENLSPELVELAIAAGYVNSTCVRDRGLRAAKDWELMDVIIQGDYTLVTLNSIDFRGRGSASPRGLYAKQEIHAGLICFGSEAPIDLDDQRDLTSAALELLLQHEDLINRVLEVSLHSDGEITWDIYPLPSAASEDPANAPSINKFEQRKR